jgi:YfiH family protein
VCAVLTADCLPVLLASRSGEAVGIAHAGWRGFAAGVVEATVARMAVAPGGLVAWLGPAIGPSAYEVGKDVHDALVAADAGAVSAFTALGGGKYLADLYALARRRLAAAGVTAVYGGGRCTHAEAQLFYSYRRDRTTGRFASLVWME